MSWNRPEETPIKWRTEAQPDKGGAEGAETAEQPGEWERVRAVLMVALGPYPEAREAVLRALRSG